MDRKFPKPRLFSSKCLGFAACRWNGVTIPDELVEKLKTFVEFVIACPEADIGLGIPRDPVRIVIKASEKMLIQLNTGKDVTKDMEKFVSDLIGSLGDNIDGFILKDRSPSCGIRDVKAYSSLKPGSMSKATSGFFGGEVVRRFPGLAVESEARLTNYNIREHFLTRIFTLAAFRAIKEGLLMKDLVEFHAANKFLLMAYSQKEMRLMGRIVANTGKRKTVAVLQDYEEHLRGALSSAPKYTANINVLIHALGYFSDKISPEERKFYLNSIEEYRREQVPLTVPLNIARSYIVRFREGYLSKQTFFEPYPFELVRVRDSGKGRSV